MQLGFNGATTMTSPFETDVQIAGQAGYDVLEITATKLDKYLQSHSIADARELVDAAKLKTHAINSIEKINFRDPEGRAEVLERTRQLAEYARTLDCPWLVSVPGPGPTEAQWNEIRENTVMNLRDMCDAAESHASASPLSSWDFPGVPCGQLRKRGKSSKRLSAQTWAL